MNLTKIGATYTFETHAPAILGEVFRNVRLLGLFDYTTARNYINIAVTHAALFPLLPAGTPNDPTLYTYLLFATESGAKTVLALPWINEATVQEVTAITVVAVIRGVNLSDLTRIQQMLVALGYANAEMRVE